MEIPNDTFVVLSVSVPSHNVYSILSKGNSSSAFSQPHKIAPDTRHKSKNSNFRFIYTFLILTPVRYPSHITNLPYFSLLSKILLSFHTSDTICRISFSENMGRMQYPDEARPQRCTPSPAYGSRPFSLPSSYGTAVSQKKSAPVKGRFMFSVNERCKNRRCRKPQFPCSQMNLMRTRRTSSSVKSGPSSRMASSILSVSASSLK